MMNVHRWLWLIGGICILMGAGLFSAQENTSLDCTPQTLAQTQADLIAQYTASTPDGVNIQQQAYQLGAALMDLALACGYVPDEIEKSAQIKRTLTVAALPEIIAALAVGTDLEAILVSLEEVSGDSFEGQLLYNSIEPGLDGTMLGCGVCHNGEAAPLTEGVWTRTDEIRLNDPLLAGYTIRRYLVESILHPEVYIAPDFANVMPPNFGSRIDLQQLAHLIAYLESQDQLIDP